MLDQGIEIWILQDRGTIVRFISGSNLVWNVRDRLNGGKPSAEDRRLKGGTH